MSLVPSLTVHEATQFLYPRVYVVSNLTLEPDGSILIPRQIRASAEYFSSEEAYLMENNMVAFIWVGLNVPAEWIQTVFGVSSIVNLDTEKVTCFIYFTLELPNTDSELLQHELPSRDTPQSRALCQFYELINEDRPRHLKLYIIKEQDGLESWMKKFLAEDRYGNNSVSYVDYLCKLHNEIRNMLS